MEKKPRGFQKGNTYSKGKGRPPNYFTRLTLIDKSFGREGLYKLYHLLYKKAMEGDLKATELLLSGVPHHKSLSYIDLNALVDVKSLQEVDKAMETTLSEVGKGELSLEEGKEAAALIEKRGTTLLALKAADIEEQNEELRNEQ